MRVHGTEAAAGRRHGNQPVRGRHGRRRATGALVALGALVLVVAAGCTTINYPAPGRSVTPGAPLTTTAAARPSNATELPAEPVAGEGVLHLRMSGPGTSWGDAADTSVVVEATVDGGPAQTFVLYGGGAPTNYSGFTGPLTTGQHTVQLSVRADLSVTSGTPTALVQTIDLTVVPTTDPSYSAIAHAPVLYGRGVNAHSDTPLAAYAESSPRSGGGTRVEYTQIWSNEDAGTGIAPVLLWGGYGRTTDIETTIIENLDASGNYVDATYQTCAACPDDYPENQVGLDHSYEPFGGTFFGNHPILRVATGNNVMQDSGTTAFRFQSALVAPPASGETRESAMDPLPLGYKVMGLEMQREQAPYTTDPLNYAAGDDRQYAIVDLATSPVGTKAVGVEIQLAGDPTWYRNDGVGPGATFYTGGHARTAVKLPLDWHTKTISGVRLRLYPTSPAPPTPPTITVGSLRVLEIRNDYSTAYRSDVPAPQVVVNS